MFDIRSASCPDVDAPESRSYQAAKARLNQYRQSPLFDPDASKWRSHIVNGLPHNAPHHPTESQFEYVMALIEASKNPSFGGPDQPGAFLEILKNDLYDPALTLWRFSDALPERRRFYSYTQLFFLRVLAALQRAPEARDLIENLKKTRLYDGTAEQWNSFVEPLDSHVAEYRSARDQLQHIRTLIDLALLNVAKHTLQQLQTTNLFDRATFQWIGAIDVNGDVVDAKRYAADQLEFIGIVADLEGVDEAAQLLSNLQRTHLYSGGDWCVSVNQYGFAGELTRSTDQLTFAHTLIKLNRIADAKKHLDDIRQRGELYDTHSTQWRSSINQKQGLRFPLFLSTDQLFYARILFALAHAEPPLKRQTDLPTTRSYLTTIRS